MDPESVALVSTAATTMVTLLTTDAWTQVKKEITGLWRRFRPEHAAAVEADLDASRAEAVAAARDGHAGAEAVAAALTTEWDARLRRLLAADEAASRELARVVATLAATLEQAVASGQGNVTIAQRANVSDHSTVIQIAGDGRLS